MSLQNGQSYHNRFPEGSTNYPGKTLGIAAMIFSIINFIGIPTAIVGLVMGYMARKESRQAGFDNTPAKIAIIVGWVVVLITLLVVGLVLLISLGSFAAYQELPVTPR